MTCIAYRKGVLAADTQITCGDGRKIRASKIQALPDGSYFACAGDSKAIVRISRWIHRGMPTKGRPRCSEDTFDVIMVRQDGTLLTANDALDFEALSEPFYAIGSGGAYAMGAMARGATAIQAVKIAARFDTNTSGPVDSVVIRERVETT
jgi:ATP-dependent protease HslVU (ClpYQ) peptidase subunit